MKASILAIGTMGARIAEALVHSAFCGAMPREDVLRVTLLYAPEEDVTHLRRLFGAYSDLRSGWGLNRHTGFTPILSLRTGGTGAGAHVVHALVRLALDADGRHGHAKKPGEAFADRADPAGESRTFADDGGVHVDDAVAGGRDLRHCGGEQFRGIGVLPLRVAVGEVRADVAERRRAEERIYQGMDQRVGVGMAGEAVLPGELDAAEDEPAPGREPVRVVA